MRTLSSFAMFIVEGKRKLFCFKSGEVIPRTGIYGVSHPEHRLPAEVTLIGDEQFPVCAECKLPVRFRLVRSVLPKMWNRSFRIRLYQIPQIADEEGLAAVAS